MPVGHSSGKSANRIFKRVQNKLVIGSSMLVCQELSCLGGWGLRGWVRG